MCQKLILNVRSLPLLVVLIQANCLGQKSRTNHPAFVWCKSCLLWVDPLESIIIFLTHPVSEYENRIRISKVCCMCSNQACLVYKAQVIFYNGFCSVRKIGSLITLLEELDYYDLAK